MGGAEGPAFQEGRRWPLVRWPQITGAVDGAELVIDVLEHFGGFGTRVTCVPPSPIPVRLELTREGVLSSVAKLFGAQDIVLGDAPFAPCATSSSSSDSRIVKGSDEAAVKRLLTPALRCAQLVELRAERVAYDGGVDVDHIALVELPVFVEKVILLDALVAVAVARELTSPRRP